MAEQKKLIHWADITANRIIKQLGDKEEYTLASGITPSGVVHFGNFRESITVDLVARALREMGKKVRFIFSWDDYDTFRKIPKNMPKQDELEKYLFQPIVDTPDPFEKEQSYARHHEVNFEEQLKKVGVEAIPLYQAQKYRAGEYKDGILKALKNRDKIAAILNEHRSTPLDENWWPISIYCEKCNRDKMAKIHFDGDDTLSYHCELCSHEGTEKVSTSSRIKLPWRVDWPMRWAHEQVDFEPGGKDHSSQGGSFTTAKEIVKEVYNFTAPIYLQYDFVSIKGAGGKMSSSSGNVITVNNVLDIYEPEMVRWIFASYKTNVDFSVSFDLDVIKTYEDFDRQERLAYGVEQGSEKKVAMAKRVYELSQIGPMPKEMPFQPAFRHLTNVLQINEGDIEKTRNYYAKQIKNDRDERRFQQRAKAAWFWIQNYAPEDFKFQLNPEPIQLEMSEKQQQFITKLRTKLSDEWDSFQTDKDLHEGMYEIINSLELKPGDVFPLLYKKLISQERGPKLAGFIRTVGKEKVLGLL
jgi:lysyl-tRNA synthetase class 1